MTSKSYDTETIKGRKIQIWIDSEGMFYAEHDGEKIERETLKALKAALAAKINKKPLNIPFVEQLNSWGADSDVCKVRKGVILSVHGNNGNLMVRYEGSKYSEQLRLDQDVMRGDTDIAELTRLYDAHRKAEHDFYEYKRAHRLVMPKQTEDSEG